MQICFDEFYYIAKYRSYLAFFKSYLSGTKYHMLQYRLCTASSGQFSYEIIRTIFLKKKKKKKITSGYL